MPVHKVSAQNFGAKVTEIAEKYNKKVEDVAEDFTRLTFLAIIENTPVGRPETWERPPPPGYIPGTAKANWFPSVGSPDYQTTTSTVSSSNRIYEINGRVAGNKVYLTNSLPYIKPLADGYAYRQQSGGWIERTVRSAEAKMNEAIRNNS